MTTRSVLLMLIPTLAACASFGRTSDAEWAAYSAYLDRRVAITWNTAAPPTSVLTVYAPCGVLVEHAPDHLVVAPFAHASDCDEALLLFVNARHYTMHSLDPPRVRVPRVQVGSIDLL